MQNRKERIWEQHEYTFLLFNVVETSP